MIREIESKEKDRIRELLAKLEYEDQKYYRKRPKSLEQLLAEKKRLPISDKVVGRNVIYVAEVEGRAVGLCWCVVYDWGAGKDGAIEEFYVESKYRGMGLGTELLMAARKLFVDEKVDVAVVWTRKENETAVKLYKKAGFNETIQLIMSFVPSRAKNI